MSRKKFSMVGFPYRCRKVRKSTKKYAKSTEKGDFSMNSKNPFENEMENPDYRTDYRHIVPQVLLPDYQLPLLPEKRERQNIRRCFNVAGLCAIIIAILPNFLYILGELFLFSCLGVDAFVGDDFQIFVNSQDAIDYFRASSLSAGLNLVVAVACNTLIAMIGLYVMQMKPRELFQAKVPIPARTILSYICVGLCIQFLVSIFYTILSSLFAQADITFATSDFSYFDTTKSTILILLYVCILAPITEEFLYRGFFMKTLSVVSIRFGIVISAVLFGLMHGNVSQMILGFCTGLFLGKIDARHNSIFPSVCVHMSINIASMVPSLLSEKVNHDALLFGINLIYAIFVVIGALIWIQVERKQPISYTTPRQSARNRVAISSPFLILAVVIMVVMLFLQSVSF